MEGVGSPPDQISGSFFTPLLISMAGIASTTIIIVAYHLFVVRYCVRRRQGSTSSGLETLPNFEFGPGIDPKVLLSIPILSYSTKDCKLFRVDQRECVICLVELENGEIVRLLPNCRHAFHVPCIDNWFLGHSNCPVCRSSIVQTKTRRTSDHQVTSPIHDDRNEVMIPRSTQLNLTTSASDGSTSSSRMEYASDFLRHSVSIVLPMEGRQLSGAAALKRSLSMDQFYYNLVNAHRESRKQEDQESSSSPSGTISRESTSYTARSVSQLDRMSARLVRSFSELRLSASRSRSGDPTTNGNILPY